MDHQELQDQKDSEVFPGKRARREIPAYKVPQERQGLRVSWV